MTKRFFITGVSGGLGLALAKAALDRGDFVTGTVRRKEDAQAFCKLSATRAFPVIMDVRHEQAVHAAVASAQAAMGGIDVLVNNAGRGFSGAIEETSAEEARDLFETNVLGPLSVLRAALPAMRERRSGNVVNIGSVSGLAAWHGTGLYGATKFALECLGRTLAQELAPLGINVTNVAPGGMRTAFAGAGLGQAAGHIEDYASTAHQARSILQGKSGHEPNDTDLVASAILQALAAKEPPLLLVLGEDALGYVDAELDMLRLEIDAWREVSRSVSATG